ncbi:MAG: M50 family metallopeptidase [Candidatus Saccharimonas sp.]
MEIVVGIIIGVIVLTLLVVAHELGHALVARRYGTVVEEFGIGFPPKAWSKKVKKSFLGDNVEFSINWLPLGGFVKMQGEHDTDTKKGDYGAMTFWQKTQVLLAGVVVNWVLAGVLISLLALVGLPKILPNQFYLPQDATITRQPVELAAIQKDLPAAKAGLQQGDQILKLSVHEVTTPESLSELAKEYKGQRVPITYKRGGVEQVATVHLRADNSDKQGYFGASPAQPELIHATWSAPIVGFGTTAQITWLTFESLGQLLGNTVSGLVLKLNPASHVQTEANERLASAGSSVAGPVAIFGIIFPAAEKAGFSYVLMIAAVISLTLAVMNILPIPALDGGRWAVTAIYKVLKKPLTPETEEKIHGTGFLVLMMLVVVITVLDVGKFGK